MPTFRQDEKLGTKVPLIKTADFNDKSVTTEKLAEGSVTNSKLAPESVTQDKFDKELLKIFEAAAGLPENLIETIQNVDTTLADHQRQISSNDDDISDLQTKTKQIKDTVDGIAISGGASVGSAVTYDNTQSGLDAQNIQNAIDELVNNLGHYETNEEWLRVYTDAENKFLWGIRIDGSIDWAVGIPRPIQKKIEELIATDTSIQKSITQLRTELTESLNKKIQSLKDNEIKNLQDTKVDKEEGKSLIEDEVKECFKVIENDEFIHAVIDSEGRLLFGIYRDSGKPYFPQNDMYHISQSEEFLWVILDAANHPLLGIQQDGTCWAAKAQWLDDIKAIKEALSSIGEALKTFQPKEDGKGLINLDVADSFFYISNDEYIIAVVDSEDRILYGIYRDTGKPYFPQNDMYHISQSEEFLWVILDAANHPLLGIQQDGTCWAAKAQWLDDIKAIKEALSSIGEALKTFQPKEDGKGLINLDVADSFFYISNDEYIIAVVDSEDRILYGIYRDTGKPYYPQNEMYHVEQNEEFFAVWLDAANHVLLGITRDGQIIGEIHAVNALKKVISQLQSDLASLQEKVGTIDTNLKELLDVFSLQDNEEYLAVEQDAEGKVLSATNPDGSKTFYTPLIPKSSIKFDDRTIYEDEVEDYKELLLDSDNKILRYTDKDDVVHENREIVFSSANLGSNESVKELAVPRSMNLPKYGYTDIKEETFYLTANEGYSDKNGILAMLVNEDTQANAQKGLTPYKYFVKSTLQNTDGVYSVTSESVSLNFYVPSDVKEVGGKFYVTSSLTNGSDGSYTVNPTSIEVTKIVDKPNVGTWEISKKTKHWCVVDIDFGSYLKGTYNVLVSFQGASTLYNRQKNLRYAFVKSDYKSKVKLKIGELLKVDKFNLKSYYSDDTKLKEPIIFRLYLQAKELRNFNEQYPWSASSIIATGATGIIKSFPVCTSVGGEFYGVQFFGYKKDKANYMLSDDEDGMIISGGVGCNWAKFDWSTWEDEMNDEPTESNRIAVEKFYQFINGSDFTKENAPKHMNINDWIDYFIFIQLFRLRDNDIHNLILYSGADKKIFSPFLYDLDLSFFVYSFNLEAEPTNTVWLKLKSLYWEEICARYKELRSSVLTQGNFSMIVSDLQSSIDYSDFEKGVQKWGIRDTKVTTGYLEELFGELLKTFDVYFNLNK